MFITRIKKDPDVRRTELMDAALELFSSAGYEKTMIIDIVKKIGVAKGTFYYYFPTKEAIVEAIYTRWAIELATSFQLESRQFTALDKLQSFLAQQLLPSQLDVLCDKLWAEKHLDLLYKIWQHQVETVFNPLLADMIQQGNQEGTLHVVYPKETIAFIWSILNCLWEASFLKEPSEVLINKIKIAEAILEQILGVEEGVLKLTITQL
ncbi:TetR/AcrR family transcriptional regulator [Sporomusa rhizae]|uniref:TetR/AcrR family transcriptional regulator n=1 Tax=Sporomusa rhizae TaxID=357999 RepID=UPI00352A2620